MTKSMVPTGHRRFMWDARTAWRKMSDEQRVEFLRWAAAGAACPVCERDLVLLSGNAIGCPVHGIRDLQRASGGAR
jgi:hypothetical protein